MSKENATSRSSATGQFITVKKAGAVKQSKVKFGSVTVSGVKPNAATLKSNVERSSQALERVTKKLVKPGITLRAKKDVPRFYAAEGQTGVFVRVLNHKEEKGRLINGVFRVID
jgi:hypothetical protein